MRVRVSYTMEISDEYRRAIARYYGSEGMATRDDVKAWAELHGSQMDDDLMHDYGDEDDDE